MSHLGENPFSCTLTSKPIVQPIYDYRTACKAHITDHKRTRSNDLSRFGVSTAPIDLLQEDTSLNTRRDAEKDHQLQSVWCALPDIS